MKPFNIILAIVFFAIITAGHAFAFFENGRLTAVVYNAYDAADNLVALDLGSLAGLDMKQKNIVLAQKNAFSLSDFKNAASFFDLSVAIFGRSPEGDTWVQWFGTTTPDLPSISHANDMAFRHAADQVANALANSSSARKIGKGTLFDAAMHYGRFGPGSFAGYNNDFYAGLGDLGSLHFGSERDMYLYKFVDVGQTTLPEQHPTLAGVYYQSVFRFAADGSIIMNPDASPTPVPIPAGILLLGSGLLPLAGCCRKNE